MRQGKIGVALDHSRQVFSRAAEGFLPVGVAFAKPGPECLERFWIAAVRVAGFRGRLLGSLEAGCPRSDASDLLKTIAIAPWIRLF